MKEHGGKEPVWAKFISAPALYTQKAVDRMTSIFQVTLPPPPLHIPPHTRHHFGWHLHDAGERSSICPLVVAIHWVFASKQPSGKVGEGC